MSVTIKQDNTKEFLKLFDKATGKALEIIGQNIEGQFESCVNPEGYKEKIGRVAGMIRRRAAASGFAAGRGRPRGHRAKARCRHGRGNAIMGESPPQPSAVARAVMNGPAPSWA